MDGVVTDKTWQPKNLLDIFITNGERFADKTALIYKPGHHYGELTYSQLLSEITKASLAFEKLGIKKDDRVIIISENRPEWVITDAAIMSLRAVVVPIHKVLTSSQIAKIVEEIKPKAIVFSDQSVKNKLANIPSQSLTGVRFVAFEECSKRPHINEDRFSKLLSAQQLSQTKVNQFAQQSRKINPETVATIIYTSGTSGRNKGAELTHFNLTEVVRGTIELVPPFSSDKFFSVLPMSHVFERALGYFLALFAGAEITYCLDINKFASEIEAARPTVVISVPRLLEKVYEKANEQLNRNLLTRNLVKIARTNRRKEYSKVVDRLFDKLIFRKIRNKLGGNVRVVVSGGAALSSVVNYFMKDIGILVVEGYGLTETGSVAVGNGIKSNRIGTVGKPLINVQIKIAPDGEIVLKGATVIKSYFNENDNQGAFTQDGYFKTGDLGVVDEDGFIRIHGRKKDIIILTTGKKIVPSLIEEKLELSHYIEQALVIGDGQKHVAAILTLTVDRLAADLGIRETDDFLNDCRVTSAIESDIERLQKGLSGVERVHNFILSTEHFSIENELLTISFKKRRPEIIKRYQAEINEIYGVK